MHPWELEHVVVEIILILAFALRFHNRIFKRGFGTKASSTKNSSQNSPSNEEAGQVDEALKRGEKSLVSSGKPPKPSLPPR